MTEPTVAEFRSEFPEFDTIVADDAAEIVVARACRMASTSHDAALYCAGHLAALLTEQTGTADGGSGVVTKETIGPRMVEYANQAMDGDGRVFFVSTAYGRMMLGIESRTPAAAMGMVIG